MTRLPERAIVESERLIQTRDPFNKLDPEKDATEVVERLPNDIDVDVDVLQDYINDRMWYRRGV